MMKRGIVIAFPGIRYTCRQQLMQDCLAFYTARGYETLCLDFAGVPFDGTADMGRAAELALPSILGRLSGVRFADYTDVAFLAKSLGTLCAVRTAKALGLRPRFFLLTPLEETGKIQLGFPNIIIRIRKICQRRVGKKSCNRKVKLRRRRLVIGKH